MKTSFSLKIKYDVIEINPNIDPNPNLGSGALINQKIIPENIISNASIITKPDRLTFFIDNNVAIKENTRRIMMALSAVERACHQVGSHSAMLILFAPLISSFVTTPGFFAYAVI